MTLRIDNAGRVVLPKPIRDRLGLCAGSDLEIEETTDGVVLKAAERRPSLIKRGSFWVHAGEISTGYEILKAVGEDVAERARQAWGL